jgi:Glycosyltransferase family 20
MRCLERCAATGDFWIAHLRGVRPFAPRYRAILPWLRQPGAVADLSLSSRPRRSVGMQRRSLFPGERAIRRAVHKMLRRDDIIWVHDYHFIPMARVLRELGCVNRIGFFMHIPWPGPEVASALPGTDAFAGALRRGSIGTFPATAETENTR